MNAVLDAISIEDYETLFTGRSTADFADPSLYERIVGDFENVVFPADVDDSLVGARVPNGLSVSREISFTFVQALRDVISDFQNHRVNPLRALLKVKSGQIDPQAFSPISGKVRDLNNAIETWPDVQTVRNDIRTTIKQALGEGYAPTSLSIKSDLADDADKLLQALRLFVGEDGDTYEGGISELSLGGANLIYLTLKLLELQYQSTHRPIANFLFVEEPESHIHTHVQKTLFERLDYHDTQIVYSTHSPQLSEVSNVERVNVLGRGSGAWRAFQPATGLSKREIRRVNRYLDAVRSNLLFAKSVILVEGDAEEILIPALVKSVLGVSLDELGISLINIRSTGFENVATLFHDTRIQKRCSIVTDSDTAFISLDIASDATALERARMTRAARSQKVGIERKSRLEGLVINNPWLHLSLAPHTFEVDFATEGNKQILVSVLDEVYRKQAKIDAAKAELRSASMSLYGMRAIQMAKKAGKGWFAILVASKVDHNAAIPRYILEAIAFAHGEPTKAVWAHVFTYRMACIRADGNHEDDEVEALEQRIAAYALGDLSLTDLKTELSSTFPADRLLDVLDAF